MQLRGGSETVRLCFAQNQLDAQVLRVRNDFSRKTYESIRIGALPDIRSTNFTFKSFKIRRNAGVVHAFRPSQ